MNTHRRIFQTSFLILVLAWTGITFCCCKSTSFVISDTPEGNYEIKDSAKWKHNLSLENDPTTKKILEKANLETYINGTKWMLESDDYFLERSKSKLDTATTAKYKQEYEDEVKYYQDRCKRNAKAKHLLKKGKYREAFYQTYPVEGRVFFNILKSTILEENYDITWYTPYHIFKNMPY